MGRYPLIALAALGLSACASSAPSPTVAQLAAQMPPPDPVAIAKTKAEREAVTSAYVACLIRAAKKLDDRKSDAGTIGQAMLSACAVEFDRQVLVYRTGDATLAQMDAELRKDALGQAVEIVLKNRQGAFR